jgi:cell division protein FtsI/penicillin-binding protein 2
MRKSSYRSRIGTSRGQPIYYRFVHADLEDITVEDAPSLETSSAPKPRTRRPVRERLSREKPITEQLKHKSWRGFSPTWRIRICLIVVSLMAAAIIANLYHYQIQRGPGLSQYASNDRNRTTQMPAKRGLIRDANGAVLAGNVSLYSIRGVPRGVSKKQLDRSITELAKLLSDVPEKTIRDNLTYDAAKKNNWNLITKDADNNIADKIRELELSGVYLEARSTRFYPGNTSLSHLLGFANNENVGNYGVEGHYNDLLKGQNGQIIAERDRAGNPIVIGSPRITEPVDGTDLTLTLDTGVQNIVEKELLKGYFEFGAEAASAIVMDPQTGAIMAWVSYPDYDPNNFGEIAQKTPLLFRDPAVGELYEPGSTFKILTAAIGIDSKAVTPESGETMPGCVIRMSQRICNFDSQGHPNQTVRDTLRFSSNVGAMWIVDRVGSERYYKYMKNFGIGSPTGIDLYGEAGGIFRLPGNPTWNMLDMGMHSFGQAVSITPLQLVSAVSAVANGGKLYRPYVVSKVTRGSTIVQQTNPQMVRQVISPESAKTTTDMLVQAVREGETRFADVKGYRVAGKTGTAQIPLPTGGYDPKWTIGTTIAYAPADNPRFVVYVRFDKTKKSPWGSNTAAPVVKRMTQELLRYYNVPPTEPVEPPKKP